MAQPTPARGEVLIRVTASGVNRADLSQIAGRYPPPPGESEILGLEVSGTLVETGEPVCALLAGGGHAEYVAAAAGQVFPAPETPGQRAPRRIRRARHPRAARRPALRFRRACPTPRAPESRTHRAGVGSARRSGSSRRGSPRMP